jgi:hypothetical protein
VLDSRPEELGTGVQLCLGWEEIAGRIGLFIFFNSMWTAAPGYFSLELLSTESNVKIELLSYCYGLFSRENDLKHEKP